jgi:hypothetical protein
MEDFSRGLSGLTNPPGIRFVQCHGLLQQHMLPRFKRRNGQLGMKTVGAGDDDRVDFWVSQEGIRAGGGLNLKSGLGSIDSRSGDIRHPNIFWTTMDIFRQIFDMLQAHGSTPNDSDLDFFIHKLEAITPQKPLRVPPHAVNRPKLFKLFEKQAEYRIKDTVPQKTESRRYSSAGHRGSFVRRTNDELDAVHGPGPVYLDLDILAIDFHPTVVLIAPNQIRIPFFGMEIYGRDSSGGFIIFFPGNDEKFCRRRQYKLKVAGIPRIDSNEMTPEES